MSKEIKNTFKRIAKLYQAAEDGKQIYFNDCGNKMCADLGSYSIADAIYDIDLLSIECESVDECKKYNPYKHAEICWINEILKEKESDIYLPIQAINMDKSDISSVKIDDVWYTLEEMFDVYEYRDGTPFGREKKK